MLVNSYGLFRQMTETRPEIVIEGTADSLHWKPYEFRWKPGDPAQCAALLRAVSAAPRLADVVRVLRFEAVLAATGDIDPRNMDPWFRSFLMRLLDGEPAVISLLAGNPFPMRRPSTSASRYTNTASRRQPIRRETGDWWHRERVWTSPAFGSRK